MGYDGAVQTTVPAVESRPNRIAGSTSYNFEVKVCRDNFVKRCRSVRSPQGENVVEV